MSVAARSSRQQRCPSATKYSVCGTTYPVKQIERHGSLVFLIITTGVFVFLAACGPGNTEGEDPPWPKGIVVETATPDTRGVVGRAEGEEKLRSANAAFGQVIGAVKSGKVDELLALVNWEERACGEATRTYCPGLPDGAKGLAVKVGSLVTLWVTAEALRPHLELILSGARFVLTSRPDSKRLPANTTQALMATKSKARASEPSRTRTSN